MERILEKTEEQLYREFLEEWNNSDSEVMVQTSGSTGTPKQIRLKKSYMRRSARRTIDFFGLNTDSVILSCMSFKYIGGKMMIVRGLETGCTVLKETPSLEPLKTITTPLSLVALVPVQMEYVLDHLSELPSVKHFLIGGSAVNDNLRKKIIESGISAWESYAMTETASHIAIRKVEYDETGKAKPFYPLEGVHLKSDEHNRLIIKDGDEETLLTNDIVKFTPDGGFYVKGRFDDMIITGGKKILPQTVEDCLRLQFPELKDFAVLGLPDDKWGERIVLAIVTEEKDKCAAVQRLENIKRQINCIPENEFPRWMHPKEILSVPFIPLNENGKLSRHALKSLLRQEAAKKID